MKRLELEKKVEQTIQNMDRLAEEQRDVSRETEQAKGKENQQLQQKQQQLNSRFQELKKDIDQIKQTIAFMQEKQAFQNRLYSRLFVSQIQTLFDCDLFTGQYRRYRVSKAQRRSFYEEAIMPI